MGKKEMILSLAGTVISVLIVTHITNKLNEKAIKEQREIVMNSTKSIMAGIDKQFESDMQEMRDITNRMNAQ